jgi:hypothetical protein
VAAAYHLALCVLRHPCRLRLALPPLRLQALVSDLHTHVQEAARTYKKKHAPGSGP